MNLACWEELTSDSNEWLVILWVQFPRWHCWATKNSHWEPLPRHTFNTIQPALLGDKLEFMGVDQHLTSWILDYLTNRPQYVRARDYVSDTIICSTGAPQGTVLAPLLFTLYTAPTSHPTAIYKRCQLCYCRPHQGRGRELIKDFVDWCQQNHFQLNTGKTKRVGGGFPQVQTTLQLNILVRDMRYLRIHLKNKLDWTDYTAATKERSE